MNDHLVRLDAVTDESGVAPPLDERETQRRLPWLRIALCVVAIAMLFGTAAMLVASRDDRRDAERQRDRARSALVSQGARTRSAERRLNAARVDARDLNTKLPTPLATTQNLGAIDAEALDEVQDLQRIGPAGDADLYNASVDRLKVLTDEHNAALEVLRQQVKALGLDEHDASAA